MLSIVYIFLDYALSMVGSNRSSNQVSVVYGSASSDRDEFGATFVTNCCGTLEKIKAVSRILYIYEKLKAYLSVA
jgi:hypothetical protein